jgi:hypothetical protein
MQYSCMMSCMHHISYEGRATFMISYIWLKIWSRTKCFSCARGCTRVAIKTYKSNDQPPYKQNHVIDRRVDSACTRIYTCNSMDHGGCLVIDRPAIGSTRTLLKALVPSWSLSSMSQLINPSQIVVMLLDLFRSCVFSVSTPITRCFLVLSTPEVVLDFTFLWRGCLVCTSSSSHHQFEQVGSRMPDGFLSLVWRVLRFSLVMRLLKLRHELLVLCSFMMLCMHHIAYVSQINRTKLTKSYLQVCQMIWYGPLSNLSNPCILSGQATFMISLYMIENLIGMRLALSASHVYEGVRTRVAIKTYNSYDQPRSQTKQCDPSKSWPCVHKHLHMPHYGYRRGCLVIDRSSSVRSRRSID